MKNYSTIQYSLIFVVVVIFVIAVWGIWCEVILKIVNVIVHGLGYSMVSSQMCSGSLNLLRRVQHIQIPQKIEFDTLSDLFAQVAPDVGLILLFLFLLFLIYLLFNKSGSVIKEIWQIVEEFIKYLLPGVGYKVTEKIMSKSADAKKHDMILFLMADPTDQSRLRLGEEFREIQEKLQLGKYRKKFNLATRMSVRSQDISQALLDLNPNIVHFSGHGTDEGALCFEDEIGQAHFVEPDALAALFEQFANQIDCVILNACYSEAQGKAISEYVEYVIGTKNAIGDKAAIAFSIGFYQALAAGRGIESACQLGRAQIKMKGIAEHLAPVLIKGKRYYSYFPK